MENQNAETTLGNTDEILSYIVEELSEINFALQKNERKDEIIHWLKENDISFEDSQCYSDSQEQNGEGTQQINSLQQIRQMLNEVDLSSRDYKVIATLGIIEKAKQLGYPLSAYHGTIRIYNGVYWDKYDEDDFKRFLEKCYLTVGVPKVMSKDSDFLRRGLNQFQESAHQSRSETENILLNFQNGTLEFNYDNEFHFREHREDDFLTYVLPYSYDPEATCQRFQRYLDKVVPEEDKQLVLAEFIGSVFSDLKHEKVLILYGGGNNGKSVFMNVSTAVLGKENVCSHSLEQLTDSKLYFVGDLEENLLNYAGEISTKVNPDMFKKLASLEPVTARFPYYKPFEIENYARLAFNCNKLPEAQETTEGFFRRFLIVPFDVYITKGERDPRLAEKIISEELSGVMNWVLQGLVRLQENEDFTPCESANRMINEYIRVADTVGEFLEAKADSYTDAELASQLYTDYKDYCDNYGLNALGPKQFSQELKSRGVQNRRGAEGMYYFIQNIDE